jgi:hypothetical protein
MITENKLMPDNLIDYAKPCMDAVISARLMYSALRHMKEQLKEK